jgi:hypothetical protein
MLHLHPVLEGGHGDGSCACMYLRLVRRAGGQRQTDRASKAPDCEQASNNVTLMASLGKNTHISNIL